MSFYSFTSRKQSFSRIPSSAFRPITVLPQRNSLQPPRACRPMAVLLSRAYRPITVRFPRRTMNASCILWTVSQTASAVTMATWTTKNASFSQRRARSRNARSHCVCTAIKIPSSLTFQVTGYRQDRQPPLKCIATSLTVSFHWLSTRPPALRLHFLIHNTSIVNIVVRVARMIFLVSLYQY